MADDRSSVDAQLAELGERIARLRSALPREPGPEPPLPKASAKTTARIILILFSLSGGSMLLNDVVDFFRRDDHVFVSKEGWKYHVWKDDSAYEAGTGKKWIEQPPESAQLVATFHGAKRSQALDGVVGHTLFLFLSILALRAVTRLHEDKGERVAASPSRK
jgi:hypothetical protein